MKFERCLDAEIVDMQILSDDYQKLVLLGSDRTLEFHTSQGRHHRLRVPKFGRELAYYQPNAELLIGQSGPEVCRFSLDEGRFLAPYATGLGDVTSLSCATETHHMVALGGSRSAVECWDPRARSCCGLVHLPPSDAGHLTAVTKIQFIGGLKLATGTDDGRVVLYDMRQTRPLVVRDHMYEKPINQIMYNEQNNWIISTCSKSMKVWDAETGKPKTAIEPPAKINEAVQAGFH